jgi:hypothetical protein
VARLSGHSSNPSFSWRSLRAAPRGSFPTIVPWQVPERGASAGGRRAAARRRDPEGARAHGVREEVSIPLTPLSPSVSHIRDESMFPRNSRHSQQAIQSLNFTQFESEQFSRQTATLQIRFETVTLLGSHGQCVETLREFSSEFRSGSSKQIN